MQPRCQIPDAIGLGQDVRRRGDVVGRGHQVQAGPFALCGGMQDRGDVVGQRHLLSVVAVGLPCQHRVVQRGQFGVGSIGEAQDGP